MSKELNHFGVIAGLFRQIGGHSSRFVLFCSFVHVDKGGGYVECPRLSTRGGEGVNIGSKLVHVVVE